MLFKTTSFPRDDQGAYKRCPVLFAREQRSPIQVHPDEMNSQLQKRPPSGQNVEHVSTLAACNCSEPAELLRRDYTGAIPFELRLYLHDSDWMKLSYIVRPCFQSNAPKTSRVSQNTAYSNRF